jgi:hypothetical protein
MMCLQNVKSLKISLMVILVMYHCLLLIIPHAAGISIQNIGGVFIVIFVGIGMACITLVFEFWYYKFRKTPKVFGNEEATYNSKFVKTNASMKNSSSFGSTGGLIDTNSNSTLKARYPPAGNFRARF